jgi:putative ABC transport system permease protein
MLTGLVFGIVPAIQASQPDLNATLKESGRGSTAGIQGRRARNALVVSEIAIAMILLVGAGLMIRSFMRVQQLELGFNPDNVLTLRLQLSGAKYRENPAATDFYKQAIERVESLPGVQSAGAISSIFLSQTPNSSNFSIEGRPDFDPTERIETPIDAVSPRYFQVAGTPLLKGRFFDERDGPESNPVVIINDTMARRFWRDEDPLGKRIKYGDQSSDDTWKTIVGVVADARRTGFDHEVRCETFLPHLQAPSRSMFVVVRTSAEPVSLAPSIRDAIWEIDKDQPIFDIKPMTALLGDMVAKRRLNTILFAIFAGVALLLAGIGIYGVMSYSVAQRTHEMGVRMALGAQPGEVRRMVLKDSFILALIGLGIGLAAAALLTRVMTSLLYGISPTDPPTFAMVPAALAVVSLLASYLPARRATRVDPMLALRCE